MVDTIRSTMSISWGWHPNTDTVCVTCHVYCSDTAWRVTCIVRHGVMFLSKPLTSIRALNSKTRTTMIIGIVFHSCMHARARTNMIIDIVLHSCMYARVARVCRTVFSRLRFHTRCWRDILCMTKQGGGLLALMGIGNREMRYTLLMESVIIHGRDCPCSLYYLTCFNGNREFNDNACRQRIKINGRALEQHSFRSCAWLNSSMECSTRRSSNCP